MGSDGGARRRDVERGRLRLRAGLLLLLFFGAVPGCRSTTAPGPPLEVVEDLDVERYMGHWYEIASYPQYFQRDCVATRAEYALRDDGRIRVLNRCRDGSLDAEWRQAEGVAWIVDPESSKAKLAVSFFWPFKGDYWVIDLGPDYEYAVVGHPERKYLWILSRTPTLPDETYRKILRRIEAQGYDLAPLTETLQPPAPARS
jgi:apolipoprotein D and lipocalin family protein